MACVELLRQPFSARIVILALWALLLITVVAIIGPGGVFSLHKGMAPEQIRNFILSFGAMAVLAFLVISMLRPLVFLPVTPFTIASGFLFGPGWGVVYAITGSMLSALLTFFLSRYLFHDYVRARVLPAYPAADRMVRGREWQFVAFLRIIPVLPFDIVGYLAGSTGVDLKKYIFGTLIGETPGAVVLVLLGCSLNNMGSSLFYISILLMIGLLIIPEIARRMLRKANQ